MLQRLTIYKIAFTNILFVAVFLLIREDHDLCFLLKIAACVLNGTFFLIGLHKIGNFLRHNEERLFIGRKRTMIVVMCSGYIMLILLSSYFSISVRDLSISYVFWTILVLAVNFFSNTISVFLHAVFKKRRRIAVLGYDDNAHRLAEKLKKKSNSYFVGHLQSNKEIIDKAEKRQPLSSYIDFAKKNHITEFYVSVPEKEESDIAILAEEAEKHCIRVNFIAPQDSLESGFYHIHYIGGLPVLKKYKEPLRSLNKQALKRIFDIIVSSFVIVFILSWLIPIISILIKLESKGPVFFKQLRSGRENSSFTCLKFRSMHTNNASEETQATKFDNRVTKVGAFLRKTSLDEFPQFLNVFLGDMSVVGPRPHMLVHTEQYSGQVNNYMVRLYLKPGLTGWAQVKGYRGEVRNVELLKSRVDHDIWYMENWSLLLDIKIMVLTFLNIIKGEENAY